VPGVRRFLLTSLVLVVAGCGASTVPSVRTEGERLQVARQMMDKRQWTYAADLLKTYVADNPGGSSVDEAIYRLGLCDLALKDWPAAGVEFERLLRDYPESDSNAAASFQLGAALEAQSRSEYCDQEFTMRALDQYERYQREYPSHSKNAEAQAKVASLRSKLARKLTNTGNLYIRLRQPEAARAYFQRVKDDFADTPLLGDAEIGLAWSDAVAGKKAEAVAALKDLESRFSGQPLAHKAAAERRKIEKFRPPEKKGLPHGTPEGPPTP